MKTIPFESIGFATEKKQTPTFLQTYIQNNDPKGAIIDVYQKLRKAQHRPKPSIRYAKNLICWFCADRSFNDQVMKVRVTVAEATTGCARREGGSRE